jgi:hypothetical protein
MAEAARLNPDIRTMEIGVRELEEITIYPLSMADQLEVTDIITKALREFFDQGGADISEYDFASYVVDLIKGNLATILEMIVDEGASKLKDITNNQAVEIAETVYEVNFGSLVKKVKSLLEKVNEQFPSGRPLPTFSGSTEDTDLKTSTEKVSETEESP